MSGIAYGQLDHQVRFQNVNTHEDGSLVLTMAFGVIKGGSFCIFDQQDYTMSAVDASSFLDVPTNPEMTLRQNMQSALVAKLVGLEVLPPGGVPVA